MIRRLPLARAAATSRAPPRAGWHYVPPPVRPRSRSSSLSLGARAVAGTVVASVVAAASAAGAAGVQLADANGANDARREVEFLSRREVEQIVTLLNACLDMESFSDEEEAGILRYAVKSILICIEGRAPDASALGGGGALY